MSEHSTSFQLRGDDPARAVALLRQAAVAGYVFPAERGWVPFVYREPRIDRFDARDRVVHANEGCLLHYEYAADHGCTVDLYDGAKRVARLDLSFESTKQPRFDREAFVARSVMTAKRADAVEAWLGGRRRATRRHDDHVVASALGLRRFRWFAYRYEFDAHEPDDGRTEVDAAGNVRASGARQVQDLAIAELLRTLPPTRTRPVSSDRAVTPEQADALAALADITRTLASRASPSKASPRPKSKGKRRGPAR